MQSPISRALIYKLITAFFASILLWGLAVVSAQAGPVVDMIARAQHLSSQHHSDKVSTAIKSGLRQIGPSGVNEALSILISRAATEDVLAGLMRGLAIIHE